jgi:two-component system, chemotaxis family, sensor kinase CheA
MELSETDEIVKEFLVESHENLDALEKDLVGLESHADPERIARIFRTIHTVKGTCGFLGFSKLEQLTHVAESLLSRLRDKRLAPSAEITSALLSTVDAVRAMLASIENTGEDGNEYYSELVATLSQLQNPAVNAAADAARKLELNAPSKAPAAAPVEPAKPSLLPAGRLERAPDYVIAPRAVKPPPPQASSDGAARTEATLETPEDRQQIPIGELLVRRGYTSSAAVERALEAQGRGDPRHVGEILVADGAIAPADVVDVLKTQQQTRGFAQDSTIRVDVGLLDRLMNLVGELVLARNQMLQLPTLQDNAAFTATLQRLKLVTSELQEGVMKTRMQPIETVWAKFPRVVRDLSRACGKQVAIEMEGADTELDRTLIEAIKDPLTHLVRNAIDHGIETPDRRALAGKPGQGTLRLRAFHEGGRVNIEIADDGAGIDPAKIARRARESRLVSQAELSRMSTGEILNLIFMAGFSTAEQVTNISGRGVGMDVVKTNIDRIGGSVDLESTKGKGTTFKLKIPLTLAIIPALLVGSGGQRFAIPQVSLIELVHLEGERAERGIEYVHGAPVYRLRGKLLPLISLRAQLSPDTALEAAVLSGGSFNIVVVQADDQQFGLIVDEIHDTEEIVVKPLGRALKQLNVYAGATILGDGRVALILDVVGLAQRSHLLGSLRARTDKRLGADAPETLGADRESLLLVGCRGQRTLAIPLASVSRLEDFESAKIEAVGTRRVVQYRGQIMPLVELDAGLPQNPALENPATQPVVVFSSRTHSVGLLVDHILDIVEEKLEPNRALRRPGILGSAIVQGRVVELLDVAALLGEPASIGSQAAYEVCA